MSRFSPSYKRDKPFTLADGVSGAADALTQYTLGKRQMGRQDAADTRAQEKHDRVFDRDKVLDDRYDDKTEYDRDNKSADRFYDRGEVQGAENIPPSGPVSEAGQAGGQAGSALGGQDVGAMPTMQGEATTLGQALERSIAADELKPMGSGVPGDYNGQFLQVDGAIPVPGVSGRYLMPQSGKRMQLEAEIGQMAEMLGLSDARTGFAGEVGSEGRTNEANIQARTQVEGPYDSEYRKAQSEGRTGSRGSATWAQSNAERRNQSEAIYKRAIDTGASESEALDAAITETGVEPDAGFMLQVSNARRSQGQQHRDEYGDVPPGILQLVEQMLRSGMDPNEVQAQLIQEMGIGQLPGPHSFDPSDPVATDSIMPYLNHEFAGDGGGPIAKRRANR